MPSQSDTLPHPPVLAYSPTLSQDFQHGLHRLERVPLLRAVEEAAQSSLGRHTLMQRAGEAACQWILHALMAEAPRHADFATPSVVRDSGGQNLGARVWLFAGPGNNGGDALYTAALLCQLGVDARVCLPVAPSAADAKWAYSQAQGAHVPIQADLPADDDWHAADWLVDGLFGIGLTRPIEAPFAEIVKRMNTRTMQGGRVLALDIPSGLDAETGQIVGNALAVEASHTLTFIAGKPGLFTGHGRDLVGALTLARLEIDAVIFERARTALQTADPHTLSWQGIDLNAPAHFMPSFARRQASSHKGTFGSIAIIGGDTGTCGAVILAARAALFTGAGRVHAAMIGEGAPPYDPPHPEIMLRHIDAIALDTMDALAIGPGLGQSSRAYQILTNIIRLGLPTLIDADALNLIAKHAELAEQVRAQGEHIVITPHPGEAARLLGVSTGAIESDRLTAARRLAVKFNCTALLKGSGTIIATAAGALSINTTGNAGLATGGSGDVLSGVIGAFLAQHLCALDAALAASYIHGQAAEFLSEGAPGIGRGQAEGPAGLSAGELAPAMRHRLNALLREFKKL